MMCMNNPDLHAVPIGLMHSAFAISKQTAPRSTGMLRMHKRSQPKLSVREYPLVN